MPSRVKPLLRLVEDQQRASSPHDHAALSASAGTGKTHVLTARVLRLLLSGVPPSAILCLTFTKAGAAEMAERIHSRLAHWVRLKEGSLGAELAALGEEPHPDLRDRARTLFAEVLDSPGGLRIQTIHAFAQSLLGAFPAEADLAPGFRPIEGREAQLLARATLADMLVEAERGGDLPLIRDLQSLSHRLGEAGAEAFLKRCARAPAALDAFGAREAIEPALRRALGVPAGDVEEAIAALCNDDAFDVAGLRRIGQLNRGWGSKGGLDRASICERWLAAAPSARAQLLEELHSVWARKDGEPRSFTRGQAPSDPDYPALATAAFEMCARLLALRRTAGLAASLAAGLRAGQAFARAYAASKRVAGVLDFDDLIGSAERLLTTPGMGDWVRYKLDQSIDHILVDEAQDTNAQQWNIVRALSEEFFAGEGAVSRHRTIFTVGDFKQAIFGFQGTDPRQFDLARTWFGSAAEAVGRDFFDLSMDRSFRSSPPVLALVDRLLECLGHQALGLPSPPNRHQTRHERRAGSVVLWRPLRREAIEAEDGDPGEEGWLSDAVRAYAGELARQIRDWLDHPFRIEATGRPIRPEDILILVRRRGDLAALIVARLHAEGVPVAGVDRLLLNAPLAVRDLLAAARFAVQPHDDLNLACLLVSPLFGWSQDDLFDLAHGRERALWPQLRQRQDLHRRRPGTIEELAELLAMTDYASPYQFFETILSGPLEGRRRLLERLGPEARDPIEELLASAVEFETAAAPALQRFLDWFARGDVEIVRDPSAPLDAVRVMTVHGSKGLQAPVVILADACGDPDRRGGGVAGSFATMRLDERGEVPIFRPRKDELVEPLASELREQEERERQEYWRLLYVALTRAEERLFVGGALGGADDGGPAEASWHRAVETALASLGCTWHDDPRWGAAMRFGEQQLPMRRPPAPASEAAMLPDWTQSQAPPEARPPRPLVPSALGDEDWIDPPPTAATRVAADRGRLLHRLFERLPAVSPEERAATADRWLELSAGVADPELRRSLVDDACTIIAEPAFADIFGSQAFAEAPIAAVTGDGSVVSGTVDRLVVADDRIRVVDFKTGRTVPATESEIPGAHLRQMAAYVAALEIIFPDRAVEAALLYTSGPTLYSLSRSCLDSHFPARAGADG
jgi:ATP-dependent helicase/nuclease subunit A